MKFALVGTLAFGVARFIVPVTGAVEKADIFKDCAHVFVGGLFGAAIVLTALRKIMNELWPLYTLPPSVVEVLSRVNKNCLILWFLAVGLTTLEVIAFFIRQN